MLTESEEKTNSVTSPKRADRGRPERPTLIEDRYDVMSGEDTHSHPILVERTTTDSAASSRCWTFAACMSNPVYDRDSDFLIDPNDSDNIELRIIRRERQW